MEIEKVVENIKIRLGKGIMEVELKDEQIKLALEDAERYWGLLKKKSSDLKDDWIEMYAYYLCMELLGFVRSKYVTVPVPNGDIIMNYKELIDIAQIEKTKLEQYVA
jgi:hypothetical protein